MCLTPGWISVDTKTSMLPPGTAFHVDTRSDQCWHQTTCNCDISDCWSQYFILHGITSMLCWHPGLVSVDIQVKSVLTSRFGKCWLQVKSVLTRGQTSVDTREQPLYYTRDYSASAKTRQPQNFNPPPWTDVVLHLVHWYSGCFSISSVSWS